MAVTLTNSAEGITPSGTTVTTGNSGGASGNAWDAVNIGASATITSDNAHAAHGSLSTKFVTTTSAQNTVVWSTSLTGSSIATVWWRIYVYVTANPSSNIPLVLVRNGANQCSRFVLGTAGTFTYNDAANTTRLTSTGVVNTNAWTRIEGFTTASATVGQLEFKLFTSGLDNSSPDETQSSTATLNTQTAVTQVFYGLTSVAAANITFWLDDVGASDTAYLGPAGVAGPVADIYNLRQAVRRAAYY